MARSKSKHYTSSTLKAKRQSSGMRPFIVCCVVSVLLLTFFLREGEAGPIHSARSLVTTAATPFRVVGNVVTTPFRAIGNAVTNLTAPQESLSELEDQNKKLTAEVARLTESAKTADRLEKLVGLRSTYSLESTAARIIGGSPDAWTKTVTIDKGTVDGLAIGMPVCNSGGVIGQIVEAGATSSTVLLLNDENSGISAMVQSSRAQGVLQGQPDGSLVLSYVPADAEVAVGDIVITSGLGGVFPKGLPLGTVTAANKTANATYYSIVVRQQSSAENNEEVLVITTVSPEQTASKEEIAQANAVTKGAQSAPAEPSDKDAPAPEDKE